MNKCPSSIFNDVIGPVMRGPSSSHVAAAARIGRLIRMGANQDLVKVIVEFDVNGSLAESYDGHGSDIGLVSGLLGMELTDERVGDALLIAEESNLDVKFEILDYGAVHPNNYRICAISSTGVSHIWEAISVGGGMIEVEQMDGFPVSMCGDYYELCVKTNACNKAVVEKKIKEAILQFEYFIEETKDDQILFNIKTTYQISDDIVEQLISMEEAWDVMVLEPIIPTMSSANCIVPFRTAEELLKYAQHSEKSMWEMAVLYESMRGGMTQQEAYQNMYRLAGIMLNCVQEGLNGTEYSDRILGSQSHLIEKHSILPSTLLTKIIRNITAIMEVKSSMGVIIAAPTAGSCGCLPGTLTGLCEVLEEDQDTLTKGLLAAGLVGVFVSEQATFAAEVAGCQAECGVGSAMAAAGITQILGGDIEACVDAASIAMQNITGLVCDPVANRVEVPCLGKNIMGGSNALSSAQMILAGYDKVIPLDETILAMYEIGQMLPIELRCTLGGLGKTKTSMKIRKELEGR